MARGRRWRFALSWPIIISAHDSCLVGVSALGRRMRSVSPMKFSRAFAASVLLAILCVAGAAPWGLTRPLDLPADPVEVSIELGTPPREIAQAWVQAGVQASPLLLYEWFRWSGQARRIRAGSYEIGRGDTPIALLNKMVRGDETLAVVRLIEGWTFRQFRAELAKADSLKPTTAAMTDDQIMAALGAAPG